MSKNKEINRDIEGEYEYLEVKNTCLILSSEVDIDDWFKQAAKKSNLQFNRIVLTVKLLYLPRKA